MILLTEIEWEQNRELSELEKEKIEAKREFVPEYDPYSDDSLFEQTIKRAIIDTDSDKLYVEVEYNKICMTNLLGGVYITENNYTQRVEERLYFEAKLEDIYKNLTEKN